ncbi:MAG: LysR family transcriptional regulator [Desulfuromonas sp.]|nr:MAG: LysR family transcriptional regulator [Desulfuromonas sp.]
METRYFKTLLKVIETGSFSRAAEALYITQSAASQRVKLLEEKLGHQLFDRSGQQLVPTEAGLIVAEKAKSLLQKERELLDALKDIDGSKRLSLCCTPTFGTAYLPDVLNRFILKNADTEDLKFVFSQPDQAVQGVLNRECDIAIIEHCDARDMTGLHTVSLPPDELVIISSRDSGLPLTLKVEELLQHRLYARRDGCSSKKLLEKNLAGQGESIESFEKVVISDDLRLTIETVKAGGGVSFISNKVVEPYAGELTQHYVEGFTHKRCRTIAVKKERADDPLLLSFIACVEEMFAGDHVDSTLKCA